MPDPRQLFCSNPGHLVPSSACSAAFHLVLSGPVCFPFFLQVRGVQTSLRQGRGKCVSAAKTTALDRFPPLRHPPPVFNFPSASPRHSESHHLFISRAFPFSIFIPWQERNPSLLHPLCVLSFQIHPLSTTIPTACSSTVPSSSKSIYWVEQFHHLFITRAIIVSNPSTGSNISITCFHQS